MFDRSAHVYDLLYGGMKGYAAEADELATLILDRRPGATSLLDVACGTGEHLRSLADRFRRRRRRRPRRRGCWPSRAAKLPERTLEPGDMRTFDLGRAFDAVTCLFSSVGYLATTDELDAAVGRMAAHLAPGGVLVIDGCDPSRGLARRRQRPRAGGRGRRRGGRPCRTDAARRGSDDARVPLPRRDGRGVRDDRGAPRDDPVHRRGLPRGVRPGGPRARRRRRDRWVPDRDRYVAVRD